MGKKTSPRRPLPKRVLVVVGAAVALVLLGGGGYFLFVRYALLNFHTVVPGQVYRSAQPSPQALIDWARRYKLKTVINLRGSSDGEFYDLERRAAEDAAIGMIDIRLTASRMPMVRRLRMLIEALETAPRPVLLHCRDGIERSGLASVLAAMAVGNISYDDARGQVSVRYLYVGSAEGGIMATLAEYEEYCRRRGLGTAGWEQFKRWALEEYYPYYYRIEIDAPEEALAQVGQAAEIPVTVTNRSGRVIPAGDAKLKFFVVTFLRPFKDDRSFHRSGGPRIGPMTPLPKKDIAPGQSVRVVHSLPAAQTRWAGTTYLDVMVDEGKRRTTFGLERREVTTFEWVVGQAQAVTGAR